MPHTLELPNLTERRHEQTRAEIADVAVALFLERGFAETTMDDVAEAAGVSRRTAYRHFPSKDDLVFEQPRRWLAHFDHEIAIHRPEEDRRELCRRGLLAVSQLIQDNAGPIARAFQVMVATPSLRGYNGRTEDEWYERYLDLFTPPGRITAARAVEIATVAGALVGTTKALVPTWVARQPHADMVTMARAALEQLDPIWPAWLAGAPGRTWTSSRLRVSW